MESKRQNKDINAIQETRKLLNELRSDLSREEIYRIRKKLNENEPVYNLLKKKR